ncbi:GvpL/GvpF family gas vesicle protein [Streptomyces tendae]|uniref:GvpL/GvpF family gas vesicle protein n=1 Tax=Streptomyces tendae TaxID=1932 RepID=UPI003D70F4CF
MWERSGSALPMTFNVLVADEPPPGNGPGPGRGAEQRLTDWITSRASSLTNRLEELSGRCELRVEITLERSVTPTDTPAQETATSATETRSPGMLRLLGKQREQRARNAAGELADTLHARVRHRTEPDAGGVARQPCPLPGPLGTVFLRRHRTPLPERRGGRRTPRACPAMIE